MSDLASTESLKERHDKAIADGKTQCPKCEAGWLEYRVGPDDHKCTQCSYSDRDPVERSTWTIEPIDKDDITA